MGIWNSKSGLPRGSSAPGWESSDEASRLAVKIVIKNGRALKIEWIETANKNYTNLVRSQRIKVSGEDFQFISVKLIEIWDLFRVFMMSPEVNRSWNRQISNQLAAKLGIAFKEIPTRHKPEGLEASQLALMTVDSLEECFIENKQILANAILESVLVLWCHRS